MTKGDTDPINPGDFVAVRMLVPRSALAAVVETDTLSQKNVLPAAGIPPRQYLETLRRPDFDVPITTLGKLRLVDRAAFVAWLRSRAVCKPVQANTELAPAPLDDVEADLVAQGWRVAR